MSRSKTIALAAGTLAAGGEHGAGVTGIANAAGATPGPSASTTSTTYAVDSSTGVHTGVPARAKPADDASAPSSPNDDSTIADVKVGDVADVRGTVSGSIRTATMIRSMTAAQADQLQADRLAHGQDD